MEPPTSSPRGGSLRSRGNLASTIGLYLGPALFVAILVFTKLDPDKPELSRMAAVATLMAVWWITEAIPLAATALLPVILFPVLGILRGRDTAPIYVNHIIFLFIGGFMIALAMEKWRLHKRIALTIIRVVGGGPNRLVLSFMIASAFLSMWISNTATAIMMLTIGLSIVRAEESAFGPERTRNLSVSLLLGIAYGCSVGGLATLVGTPPNLSLARIFEISFPQAPPISFGQWMLLGVPLALVMLALIWVLLTRVFFRSPDDLRLSSRVIQDEYQALGRPRFAEWAILAVFVSTALLWVFRKDLVLGACTVPGWSRLVPTAGFLDDGTIAITMAFLLFLIPSRSATPGACPRILDIEVFRKVPWHIVLLFGGGFALAKGFQVSGLSEFVGARFAGLEGTPPVVTIGAICGTLTFLTELTSNTATTEMVLPILASVGVAMKTNPLLLMIPATLSASCAFMMPVATPPNAIVFGSGRIRIADMVKVGLVLNLVGILVITTFFYFLGTFVFDIDPATLPEWTAPSA